MRDMVRNEPTAHTTMVRKAREPASAKSCPSGCGVGELAVAAHFEGTCGGRDQGGGGVRGAQSQGGGELQGSGEEKTSRIQREDFRPQKGWQVAEELSTFCVAPPGEIHPL